MADANKLTYRPDIDGLRTVAVGAVVLYHAKLGILPGGFVGVDVFFVISGFLISSIVLGELADNRFSIAGFYERRIRRILPALMTVLATSFIAGAIVFPPQDFVVFAKSMKAAALFYANFFFHGQSGYFAPDAEMQPLLHTWSLAVEEQFYVVAPLFLLLIARLKNSVRFAVVTAALMISLIVSACGAFLLDSAAFYLPHSRAFELLLGMLLALGVVPSPVDRTLQELAGLAGLALIAYATFFFSASTPFPGLAALVPCAGAALVIWSGAANRTLTFGVLSSRVMVFTGKISYSLYLWHWPVLVFVAYEFGDGVSVWDRVGLVVVAYVLSVLTYTYVEQPARQRTFLPSRNHVFVAGAAALLVAVGLSQLVTGTRGLPERLGAEIAAFDAAVRKNKGYTPCPENESWINSTSDCEVGQKSASARSFLMWGDSHARMLSSTAAELASEKAVKGVVVFRGGCPPFLDIDHTAFDKRNCSKTADEVERLLSGNDFSDVLLVARWALYAEGGGYRNGKWFKTEFDQGTAELNRSAFRHALTRTIEKILASGRSVTLLGPVPDLPFNPPDTMIRTMMRGGKLHLGYSLNDFHQRQAVVLALFKELEARPGVRVVYPHRSLCPKDACLITQGSMPIYTDDNHLGVNGAAVIRRELADAIGSGTSNHSSVGVK